VPEHQARFPGLKLAWQALEAAEGTPAVLNAANEEAVAAFLAGRIRFDQIHAVNAIRWQVVVHGATDSLDALLELDARPGCRQLVRMARSLVAEWKELNHGDDSGFCRRVGTADCGARIRPLPRGRGLRRRVLRFSVGFGKTLLRWQPKGSPTEFVIACISAGRLCAHARRA
jgi:hypothetical protein